MVLGGGGAKGAYQIGVIYALAKAGIFQNINCLSGTSIGALNMALTQIVSIDEAVRIWVEEINKILFEQTIKKSEVVNMINIINYNPKLIENSYLRNRINLVNFFDRIRIENLAYSNNFLFATCTDVTNSNNRNNANRISKNWYVENNYANPEYFQLNNKPKDLIYRILLASSAMPVIYQPIFINGRYYADGGLLDNLPISPVSTLPNNQIIVISCGNVLSNKLHAKYPKSKLYIFKPSKDLGNLFTGTLNFSKEKISYMINLGFKDGTEYLKTYSLF